MYTPKYISSFLRKVIIFSLLLVSNSFGKDLIELESELNSHILNLQSKKLRLDSLNFILNKQAEKIDLEKAKENAASNNLKNLFSSSIKTSEAIIQQQIKIDSTKEQIESLKLILVSNYTGILDSLRKLPQNGTTENEILRVSEKYLLVSSKEHSLGFEIEKISNLSLSKNKLENEIFLNYLENALQEVDKKIESISKTKSELEEIEFLESATNEFLEEIDEQERIGVLSSQSTFEASLDRASLENLGNDKFSSSDAPANSIFNLQILSFHSLLSQLKIDNSFGETVTSENYIEILKKAEKKLKDYREIILDKKTLFE